MASFSNYISMIQSHKSRSNSNGDIMRDDLLELLSWRKGHFQFESGHHGDLWIDLDALFAHRSRIVPFIEELARRLGRLEIDAVCGPQTGGATLADELASRMNVKSIHSERIELQSGDGHISVTYRISELRREGLRDKRIAIVDDAINAGSAVHAAIIDARSCGAKVVAIASFIVLGSPASELAAQASIPLETIARLPGNLWLQGECPLCASGVPFSEFAAQAAVDRDLKPAKCIVLFDGECNLCNRAVYFIIKRDPIARVVFASLDSPVAVNLVRGSNVDLFWPAGMVVIDQGKIFTKSSAVLQVARRLSFPWTLAYGLIVLPRCIRDWAYDWIARNRYLWFGKREACIVPTPETRERFLNGARNISAGRPGTE